MNIREIWSSGTDLPVALWWIALFALGILVRSIYYSAYRNQPARHLWWLRFAAIALTLIALADLSIKRLRVDLPELVIALDCSQSSGLPNDDWQAGVSRLDKVKSALSQERLESLAKRYRLSFWQIGSQATKLDSRLVTDEAELWNNTVADQSASRLGDAIVQIIEHQSGRRTAGVLLFTDGAITGGVSLADAGLQSAQQNTPVFAVGLGSLHSPPNIALSNFQTNRRARVNQPITVTVDFAADSMNDETCHFVVSDLDSGEQLAEASIDVSSDKFRRTIPFQFVNKAAGSRTLLITATSPVEESSANDNRIEKQIQVVAGKTRVLIVQEFPSPWYRFLKGALIRAVDPQTGEKAFEVHTLLQQASKDYAKIDQTAISEFPALDKLLSYDLVVIGDALLDSLGRSGGLTEGDLEGLEHYVQLMSGNVVFVPGPMHYRQFAQQANTRTLLPLNSAAQFTRNPIDQVRDQKFNLQFLPAAEGFGPARALQQQIASQEQPVTFQGFRVSQPDSSVLVLAGFSLPDDETMMTGPAITLQKFGSGTVITHLSDEFYKMRFRSDADPYENYWVRLVTELAAERLQNQDQLALLSTDAPGYSVGETVEIVAEIFDPLVNLLDTSTIEVLMTNEQGDSGEIPLLQEDRGDRRYQTSLNQLAVGKYRLVLATAGFDSAFVETRFEIVGDQAELTVLNQQEEQLSTLAENSGGSYVDIKNVDQLWRSLPLGGGWNQVGSANTRSIWSWWYVPCLFAMFVIGLLVVEWIIRRRLRLE